MAQSPKGPRTAVSPKFRQDPVKEEAGIEPHSEVLEGAELAPEDSFVSFSTQALDWMVENRNVMIGVVAGAFLLAIGASVMGSMQDSKARDASAALYSATSQMPQQAAAELTDAERSKFRDAAKALEAVAAQNGGERAGEISKLYAGYSLLQAGDASEALAAFQAAGNMVKEPLLKSFAFNGQASAHAMAGNTDAAIDTMQKASDELTGVWQQTALMDLGRSLEGAGKADEAAKAYERLLTGHEFSAFADDARARLEVLKPNSELLKSEPKVVEDSQ